MGEAWKISRSRRALPHIDMQMIVVPACPTALEVDLAVGGQAEPLS
jgi:hypothetical protein